MPFTIYQLTADQIRSTLAIQFPGIVENQHYQLHSFDDNGTPYFDVRNWFFPNTQHPGMFQINQWANQSGVRQTFFDDTFTQVTAEYNSLIESYRSSFAAMTGRFSTITRDKRRTLDYWDSIGDPERNRENPRLALVYAELDGVTDSGQPWGFLPDGTRTRLQTDVNIIEFWRVWAKAEDDVNSGTERVRIRAKQVADGEKQKNIDDPNYLDTTILLGIPDQVKADLRALDNRLDPPATRTR